MWSLTFKFFYCISAFDFFSISCIIFQVVSFTGEKRAIDKYNKFVNSAYKSAIHEGTAAGMGIGCVLFVVFSSYSLAVWYGSKLIIEKGYNGGAVINVIMAIMTGAMYV